MSESPGFLGFRIQWRRKRGTSKWYVYTFIADRPIPSVKDKIRALTQQDIAAPARGIAGPAQPDHARLGWLLQVRGLQAHPRIPGKLRVAPGDPLVDAAAPLEVERRPPAPHRSSRPVVQAVGGRDRAVQHREGTGHSVSIPRRQGPQPLGYRITKPPTAETAETRYRGTGTAGSASGLGKRTGSNSGTAPQADSTTWHNSRPPMRLTSISRCAACCRRY